MNAEPDRADEEEAVSQVEDDVIEDGGGVDAADTVAEDPLAELQAKADENWDKYLRAAAELENVRKRAARDVEKAHKFALERFAPEKDGFTQPEIVDPPGRRVAERPCQIGRIAA